MKNNKGFSMLELLATITILGILSVIAISSVQRISDKSEEEYYKEQENAMSMAAQSYYQNNRNKLPKSIGHIKKIKLLELINTNYINQIKSKSEKNCSTTDSYVEVIKYSQTGYQYVPNLDCGSEYKTNNSRGTNIPTIVITMPTVNENETIKNITIKGNIKGDASNNSKLISYSYIIYAAPIGTNIFKEIKNSGSVISRGKSKEISINVDQYLPAKIKVQITAINEHGRKKVVTSQVKEYNDIKHPICPDNINDTTMNIGSSTIWENIDSRTIKVICRDQDGVGCARPFFTQVFTNEAKTDVIKIKDKKGNEHTCRVNVYIDRNYPTLKVTLKNNSGGTISSVTADSTTEKNVESGWKNKKVTIGYDASDTLGLKSIKIQKSGPHKSKSETASYNTGTTTNLEAAGYLYNKTASGNLATVTQDGHTKFKITLTDISNKKVVVYATVSYDETNPKLTIDNPSNGEWTNKSIKITANHSDEVSEIKKLEYGYNNSTWTNWSIATATKTTGTWSADRNDTLYVRVTDSAGNSTTKNTKVKIDTTGPKITYDPNKTKQSGGWYPTSDSSPFSLTIKCTDTGIGVDKFKVNGSNASNPKVITRKSSATSVTYSSSCTDELGNSTSDSKSYSIKKYAQHSSCSCAEYDYYWGSWTTKTGTSYPGNGLNNCNSSDDVDKYNREKLETYEECVSCTKGQPVNGKCPASNNKCDKWEVTGYKWRYRTCKQGSCIEKNWCYDY